MKSVMLAQFLNLGEQRHITEVLLALEYSTANPHATHNPQPTTYNPNNHKKWWKPPGNKRWCSLSPTGRPAVPTNHGATASYWSMQGSHLRNWLHHCWLLFFWSHSPPHQKLREMRDIGLRCPPINWNNQQSTNSGVFGGRDIGEEARWSGSVWGFAVSLFGLLNEAGGGGTKKNTVAFDGSWSTVVHTTTNQQQPVTTKERT